MVALLIYGLAALAILGIYLLRRRRRERVHVAAQQEAERQGLNEPPSLHPIVSPSRCIGSGGCVVACPEEALGIVGGKAVLVNAAACIGHGACEAACPVDAIQLVFGTEKRGIDIPEVSAQFESNVPGLFIAGELGGMGLVRKAAEQGRQAMEAVARRGRGRADCDVVIVGAGPAGISAGLSALEHKLTYRLIEQEDSLGGTVYHYPRNKLTMTAPVKLALVGSVRVGEIKKEALLDIWKDIVQRTGLELSLGERMEDIAQEGDLFAVRTNRGTHRAASVVLAIGRRGSPRKLGVPGEETPKVVYRLVDAEQYQGQAVLVVGGGDSALEAAVALSEQPGTSATLSYRGDAFSRVKEKNRQAVREAQVSGRLRVEMSSTVERVEPDAVLLQTEAGSVRLPNQAVIVCAGGVLPIPLLQKVGVRFATKHGTV